MATAQKHPIPKQTGWSKWSVDPAKRGLTPGARSRGWPQAEVSKAGWERPDSALQATASSGPRTRRPHLPKAGRSGGRWLPSERAGLGQYPAPLGCLSLPHCLKKRLPPYGQHNWPLGTGGPAEAP